MSWRSTDGWLRSLLTAAVVVAACGAATARAQDEETFPRDANGAHVVNGPPGLAMHGIQPSEAWPGVSGEAHQAWLNLLREWRATRRIYVGYDPSRYELPALRWTQSAFIQTTLMAEDRYFYDPETRRYTVDRYLDDLVRRYGGIDSVIVWPVYPNLGIDGRNQIDMISCLPGGIAGVRQMVADFHRRGVRVLFPMTLWDQGTRDPGRPWTQAIAEVMAQVGADGVFGDTQDGVPLAFTEAADRAGHPLAFQPERFPNNEALAWNLLSWWQFFPQNPGGSKPGFVPQVLREKWFETRHQTNVVERWSRDKTDYLQLAFFNGIGWESWENLWGIWNGLTPRDAEATRRMATIERAIAPFLVSPDWEPFYPTMQYGVFASRWPLAGATVWTVVNRNEYDVGGRQLTVPYVEGVRYFDLYRGTEIPGGRHGDAVALDFQIEAHGFGSVVATAGAPSPAFVAEMERMKAMTGRPLASYSHEWHFLPQTIVPVAATQPLAAPPPGMVRIPGGNFVFSVQGLEIEGDTMSGLDVAYPWEDTPQRFHRREMSIKAFFLDRYPVTNAQFKAFLDSTRYHPGDDLHFLEDWKEGTFPPGWDHKPVTWVSLEDARAYAAWAGKRLPHEWEWQYAAQGTDGRAYPWGDDWRSGAVPLPEKGRTLRGPDDVDAHPSGASPFGVMDLAGNVWQYTDEFRDEHTRAAVLRGGSYYQPQGSLWYFPEAYRNDQHGKYLLMAPSRDRSATVGFRCAADAVPD